MNKELKEQIIRNLKEIERVVQKMDSGKYIPHIEIDIALSKTRELYENLQWFNQEEEIESSEPIIEQPSPEPPIAEVVEDVVEKNIVSEEKLPEKDDIKSNDIQEKLPEEVSKPTIPEEKEILFEEDLSSVEDESDDRDFIENEIEEEVVNDSVEMIVKDERNKPDLFDQPAKEGKVSINEKILSDNPKTELSQKIHKTFIKDLRDGIGVNDKFTYIRELFGGDVNRFNETVVILNNTDNLKSAQDYIDKNFDWDFKSVPYKDFKDLVERKFLKE